TGIPDLRHLCDLVAFELHDVDVIRTDAASCRGNRTALARMSAMEDAVSGDVVAGTIRREGLQLVMSVGQDGQHALHPIRVLFERLQLQQWLGLRRKRRVWSAVGAAPLPTLARFTCFEEGFRYIGDRCRPRCHDSLLLGPA